MNCDVFISTMRTALAPIESRIGSILYSSYTTLKPGPFYLLGLNPGGEEGETLRHCIDHTFEYMGNSYLDEHWPTKTRQYVRGGHPLQRHLVFLFNALGQDIRNVCGSNLIFTKSIGQGGAGYPQNADICWPVHQHIITIVRPSILLVFGNGQLSPFSYIWNLHVRTTGSSPEEISRIPAQYGNWMCRAFRTRIEGCPVLVIGLPHLSRYSLDNRPTVMDWIRNLVKTNT